MNQNSLSACYITWSELLFILLQLIIVSFVELKGFLHFQLSKRCRKHKIDQCLTDCIYIKTERTKSRFDWLCINNLHIHVVGISHDRFGGIGIK